MDLVPRIQIPLDGVDEPVELEEFEKLLGPHGKVSFDAQAQKLAEQPQGLGQGKVVALQ